MFAPAVFLREHTSWYMSLESQYLINDQVYWSGHVILSLEWLALKSQWPEHDQ